MGVNSLPKTVTGQTVYSTVKHLARYLLNEQDGF